MMLQRALTAPRARARTTPTTRRRRYPKCVSGGTRRMSHRTAAMGTDREATMWSEEALEAVDVPRDLCQIRAYVRWEEAGKPQDTTTEWQEEEFRRATLDLKREVANGTTLNEIRRRYGQAPVEGDDESRALQTFTEEEKRGGETASTSESGNGVGSNERVETTRGAAEVVEKSPPKPVVVEVVEKAPPPPPPATTRRGRDLRSLLPRGASMGGIAYTEAKADEPTTLERWRDVEGDEEGRVLISDNLYPVADGQLLVQVFECSRQDEEAMSGPRRKVTSRQVVMTTDALEPLVCHWGVAKEEPGEWVLAPKTVRPVGTEVVSHMSCETSMDTFTGCFPTERVSSSSSMDDADMYDKCALMQRLVFELPGEGADELMGLQFVFRNADGNQWYKDTSNGNANYRASCIRVAQGEQATDELVEIITRAEAGDSWWSLMHRFNLARSLLEKYCVGGESSAKAVEAAAKIFVWLRYSSIRQLTWQRNYNVKPRELSSAQSRLTQMISDIYVSHPHLRDMARLMLSTVGKGGEGGQGQQIRDEILNIMHRNNIKEVKGIWMEEWHQKLHNNTTPDDIIICQAYLNFLRAEGDIGAYWQTLEDGGVTKERLESFERPVRSEPIWRPGIKDNLIKDFENYLKILKSVHSGADLSESFRACERGLSAETKSAIEFVAQQQSGGNVFDVVNACLEARHGLRDAGLADPKDAQWCRDLLYLDLSVAEVSNRAIQRGSEAVTDTEGLLELTDMVLEDLCLSLPSTNDDLLYSLMNLRRVRGAQRGGDASWALRAKATVDRIRLAVTEHATDITNNMQPAATTIGKRCKCDSWTVDLFSEEVIRGGPAFALSLMLTRLDPYLRREAKMGDWQIISPADCAGQVLHVKTLAEVMNDTFKVPTVLICDHVGGDEEIPSGAVAVLTGSSVDVLSHSAVRARNGGVLFATCYEPTILDKFKGMNSKSVALSLTPEESVDAKEVDFAFLSKKGDAGAKEVVNGHVEIEAIDFAGEYAIGMDAFTANLVGAKARNTKILRDSLVNGGIPDWIQLPRSIAIPFGTFEHVLAAPENAKASATMDKLLATIDDSSSESLSLSLRQCRACARSVVPPAGMLQKLADVMRDGGLTPPSDDDGWDLAWKALCDVWASKWNERAYVSMRNRGLDHNNLRMSVLVQPVVNADHAFVIHTVNPSTNDQAELYAELVQGLGETLVGNYPGRALSFTVAKNADGTVSPPTLNGYPSKNTVLRVPCETLIFRSDSNGEDLEGYAGAGLYESVPMHAPVSHHADYASDPVIWDRDAQTSVLDAVARAGVAIERALGAPQDVEGVVRDGQVHVVQTRPQV